MLTRRIIPCLDCRDGRVVKGVKFQNLRDSGSPIELAAAYEAQGADELVLLDVSATPEGRKTALETVAAVRDVLSIPLTVGGGVRDLASAGALLEAGADKISTNTAAVDRPELLREIADTFGAQCTVLAIDAAAVLRETKDGGVRRGYEVVTHSGTERPGLGAIQWAQRAVALGTGEILLTSWDRDGTREGYDLELLRAMSEAVNVPIIASGGADSPAHMIEALRAGGDAVLAASIFHDGDYTVAMVKDQLATAGIEVRR